MFRNGLLNLLSAIVMLLTLAFTVREAFATSLLRAEGNAVMTCASLPSRYSFHTDYVKEAGTWIIRTEDGPTGVDGGLAELLAAYRTCKR